MKAVFLVKHGKAEKAFEIRETPKPTLEKDEVLIKVEAFGLNYADVMARHGLYRDAPDKPCVLGYDVVGEVVEVSNNSDKSLIGKRVVGLTRFGGYAEYAKTSNTAIAEVSNSLNAAEATAVATQYCTAYYASQYLTQLHEGEKVIIHACAGGVGTALTQIAKLRGCEVYGLTSRDEKFNYLKENGVDHPINYIKEDYHKAFKRISGDDSADVIFNSMGGSTFKKDFKLLRAGGRLATYGAAEMSGKPANIFTLLGIVRKFGFYSPVQFMSNTRSVLGINMLRVADFNRESFKRSLDGVVKLIEDESNSVMPMSGGIFSVSDVAKAHEFLESRKSTGKIAVTWN